MDYDLKDLMEDYQMFHSQFQQDYFITARNGLTEYGMYKQALREVYSRYKTLKDLYFSREKVLVDIDEKKSLSEKDDDEFVRRKAVIEHRELLFSLEDRELTISETEKEFKRFVEQALYFKNKFGNISEEDKKKLDEEMWFAKIREMCAVDLITSVRLRNTTYEIIIALPSVTKNKILAEIKTEKDKLVEWYENREDIIVSEELPELDFNKLNLLEE